LFYLPLYGKVQSVKVDTTALSVAETSTQIRNIGEMLE